MAGIPIYADRGKEGGYRIIESFTVDRHFFAPKELSTLTSFIRMLNTFLNHAYFKKTEEKLLNLVPQKGSKKHDTLIMDFNPWGIDENTRHLFQIVYRAVEERQVIHIQYSSASGQITTRQIEPVSVIIKGAAWYVYAHCKLRNAMRLFKITRIMAITPEPCYFNPEAHPPYNEELQTDDSNRKSTLFVLNFAPSAQGRITDYYNADNLKFMPDGSIMGFFTFPEDEWVYS